MEQIPLTLENLTQAFRDFTEKKRKQLADKGAAMEDGSYPIVTRKDLENAIQAFGRSKDPEATKRHIRKRARALGLEELLPESWDEKKDTDADAALWGEAFGLEAFEALPDNMTGLVPGRPIQLFRLGDTVTIDKRKIRITAEDAVALIEDAQKRENDLPIMYQHGEDPTKGFEAGGWVDPKSITVRDGGIWADRPYWQRDLYDGIRSGRWRYISPHVYPKETPDDDGFIRPASWLEISTTNIPAIQGMAPLAAAASTDGVSTATQATPADAGARIGNAPSDGAAKTGEPTMSFSTETLARLGLADGASPEDVEKAVGALADKIAELTKPAPAVEPPPPVAAAAQPAVDLAAKVAELEAKAEQAAKAEQDRKIAAAVEKAVAEGKVTAAQKDGAVAFATADLDGFIKFAEALPVVAPVSKDGKLAARTAPKSKRFSNDHIGAAALTLDPDRLRLHQDALAYSDENKVSYADAVRAVSRK